MKAFSQYRSVALVLSVLVLRGCVCHAKVCGEKFTISQQCMKKYGMILKDYRGMSSKTCANTCTSDTACLSTVFDPQTTACTTNAGKATLFARNCDYMVEYMTLESSSCRPVQFGDCDLTKNSGECSVTNSRCYNDTCECIRGYSYSVSEGTCVEDCSNYGDTFTKIAGYYIPGMDLTVLMNFDLDTILNYCLAENGFTCRTIEYTASERKGTLSPLSATEDNLKKKKEIDIYQRNCV